MFLGRFSYQGPIIFVVNHAESLRRILGCFVFQMLLYFLQFWGLNEYYKQALLTLCCKYSGTKSHKPQFVYYLQ
jgi:hypothetical protein